jgi:predicted small lipoprotein YifL
MIRRTHLLVAGLALLGIAGCGLKGPLYLPDAKQEEVAAPGDNTSATGKQSGTQVPPAPQAQKRDRNKSGSTTTSGETTPATTPPPPQGS